MKCHFCWKAVAGNDPKRVEVRFSWVEPNVSGPERVYGPVPGADGRLADAHGVLARVYHSKCWLANKRRQQLQEAKAADPSAQPRQQPDWREPVSARVEDIRPRESDRSYRGA